MDWLIENFGKLLPIILMVIYFWVNAKKKGSEEDEPGGGEADADQAERARTIQEEIRRRILERQQGAAPRPRVAPPVPVEEGLHQAQTAAERSGETWSAQPAGEVYERAKPQGDYAQVLERQRQLAERLEQARRLTSRNLEARDRSLAASAMTTSPVRQAPEAVGTSVNPLRKTLLGDLSDRKGLRRAVILREVLGKPVGMRS
ncbi:MAG: hypothetical protein R3F07_04905 [Opitutaceae bacterium]